MQIQNVIQQHRLPQQEKMKKVLNKDDFLKLMITQMQNQDPLDPMDNSQMTAQMAQFSSLEQMTNLNKNFSESNRLSLFVAATQLIGKEVLAKDPNHVGETPLLIQKKVESIQMGSEGPILTLEGNTTIGMENIFQVQERASVSSEEPSLQEDL